MKEGSKGKSSQRILILTIHLDVHFVWIERWPELLTETDLWAVPNGMVECSRICKEQDWKTANEKSRKRYVEALLSEWAQTMKITLSHMSASRACFSSSGEQNDMPCASQTSSRDTSAYSMGP